MRRGSRRKHASSICARRFSCVSLLGASSINLGSTSSHTLPSSICSRSRLECSAPPRGRPRRSGAPRSGGAAAGTARNASARGTGGWRGSRSPGQQTADEASSPGRRKKRSSTCSVSGAETKRTNGAGVAASACLAPEYFSSLHPTVAWCLMQEVGVAGLQRAGAAGSLQAQSRACREVGITATSAALSLRDEE